MTLLALESRLLDHYGAHIAPYGVSVYMGLLRYADAAGQTSPSYDQIRQLLGISRRSVIRTIDLLVQVGLITKATHGQKNVYTLLPADQCPTVTSAPQSPADQCPTVTSAPQSPVFPSRAIGNPEKNPRQGRKNPNQDLDLSSAVFSSLPAEILSLCKGVRGDRASDDVLTTADALVVLYNDTAHPALPRVRLSSLSPARRANILKALKQRPARAFWVQVFQETHHSTILRGERNGPDHRHWICTLDWIVALNKSYRVENYLLIAEGKYRDAPPRASPDAIDPHKVAAFDAMLAQIAKES